MTAPNTREWTARELRLTRAQAAFLAGDKLSTTLSVAVENNTEDSLSRRGMLTWSRDGRVPRVVPSHKGIAALNRYVGLGRVSA